jgi:hypothetical protein
MAEEMIEAVDGFLLGDGGINRDKRSKMETARLHCGLEHEEFCRYLIKPFEAYNPTVSKFKDKAMKQGFQWQGYTKFHPDIYKQRQRWYPGDGKKQVPYDVRLTPLSVMLWYLGDGSLMDIKGAVTLRLSTDGFLSEGVERLVNGLNDLGIKCVRNKANRIYVNAKGIPAFFDLIGRVSPVKCYDYKFKLPEWRFEAKRMKDVAEELGVDYSKLAYLVKIGKIGCYRASEKGRPRFLPEHIESVKEMIKTGELS